MSLHVTGVLPRLLLALLLLGGTVWPCHALVDIPPLHTRVTDVGGVLRAEERDRIEAALRRFEERKGAQLAVLIVPATAPETIEQYGIRVADAWKLGRRGVDDGLLLLVAIEERALRIEVGYGLEGAVPDAVAKRVIDETIAPRFRRGDFAGGIDAGMRQLMGVIDGEPLPPPPTRESVEVPDYVMFLFFALVLFGNLVRRIFGYRLGAGLAAGVLGLTTWFATGVVLLSLVMGVMVLLFILLPGLGRDGRWSAGGPGGGFGGGSVGGGGFRGGGGSFGGGGASGRW